MLNIKDHYMQTGQDNHTLILLKYMQWATGTEGSKEGLEDKPN